MKRSSAKAKGSKGEREVARILGGKRAPLSGAIAGQGDILLPQDGIWRDWIWEIKRRGRLGAVGLERALYQAAAAKGIGDPRHPIVAAREDSGDWYCFAKLEDFVSWANALAETGQKHLASPFLRQIKECVSKLEKMLE